MNLPDGWFADDDIAVYRSLYEQVPDDGWTIELGCFLGRSICSVADIVRRKKLHVYVVDTFKGTHTPDEAWAFEKYKERDIKEEFCVNAFRHGLDGLVAPLEMTTLEAAKMLPNRFFDLIFIDADHSYEAVKADILAYQPKLKKNHIFAGDDYTRESVISAVNELLIVRKEASLWISQS